MCSCFEYRSHGRHFPIIPVVKPFCYLWTYYPRSVVMRVDNSSRHIGGKPWSILWSGLGHLLITPGKKNETERKSGVFAHWTVDKLNTSGPSISKLYWPLCVYNVFGFEVGHRVIHNTCKKKKKRVIYKPMKLTTAACCILE